MNDEVFDSYDKVLNALFILIIVFLEETAAVTKLYNFNFNKLASKCLREAGLMRGLDLSAE